MFTVLIMNRKTLDSFSEYSMLTKRLSRRKDIGLCRWIESADSLEAAVPELREMTEDKEAWRAIVVSLEDDGPMQGFAASAENPFDFEGAPFSETERNPVPLIRLCHMLGGLPPLEPEYSSRTVDLPDGSKRLEFDLHRDAARQKQWQDLADFYEQDLYKPEQIFLVRRRRNWKPKEEGFSEWQVPQESQSSLFWKKNRYPAACRFLCIDSQAKGSIQQAGDDFQFWTSLILLASNEIDSSFLQAFRLYRMETVLDQNLLKEAFGSMAGHANAALGWYQDRIRLMNHKTDADETLPDLRKAIGVEFHPKASEALQMESSGYGPLPLLVQTQLQSWNQQKKQLEEELEERVRTVNRAFERKADQTRGLMQVEEHEVEILNKYQQEDLQEKLEDTSLEVLDLLASLPDTSLLKTQEAREAEAKLRRLLKEQTRQKPFLFLAATLVILSLILVGITWLGQADLVHLTSFGIVMAMLAALLLAVMAGLLFWHQHKKKKALEDCLDIYQKAFSSLSGEADAFSEYLKKTIEHIRGVRYLDLFRKKEEEQASGLIRLRLHIRSVNEILDFLQLHNRAFHLGLNLAMQKRTLGLRREELEEPSETSLFILEEGTKDSCMLNHSGKEIDSPFSFTESLQIRREELYDPVS